MVVIITRNNILSIMVLYAITLHLMWGGLLAFADESVVNATALHALYRYIHNQLLLAAVVTWAALCAAAAMIMRSPWSLALLLPQQILLMMSAAGAVEAIWTSQFADGVIRPRAFIAADQFYSVLAAIGHTAAIIMQAHNRGTLTRHG